jgi:hypothetical protein
LTTGEKKMKTKLFQFALITVGAMLIFIASLCYFWELSEPGPVTREQKLGLQWEDIRQQNVERGVSADTVPQQ